MLNNVQLIGHVGKVSTYNDGKIISVSLCTTKNYKDKEGNWKEEKQWHTVKLFSRLAEQYPDIAVGSLIYVDGEVTYRKYEEKFFTDIIANRIRILTRKTNGESKSVPQEASGDVLPENPVEAGSDPVEDDLPF